MRLSKRSFPIVAAAALLASMPAGAQTAVPPPMTPPDQPLPGQSPTPSVVIIAPPVVAPPPIELGPGFGGRSPLSDTSPSARAVGEGGRAIGDTSPSSVGAPPLRPPGPAPGEPGYTGSAAGGR